MTADDLAALRDATRVAHEVLRDLRTERRAVEQLIAGIEGRVQRAVGRYMQDAVKTEVAKLGEATEKAMRDSVAKVGREFDRLERILTGRDSKDRPPLADLLREAAESNPVLVVEARRRAQA